MNMETTGRFDRGDGVELAWAHRSGNAPTVVFLPGYRSDMNGEKATALAGFCAERGQAMLRLDYSGHGISGGRFEDGTIGRWCDDALAVLDRQSEGSVVLVGSSMGGWIALHVALARKERIAGLVGIAAAPDFTETLMWQAMTFEQRATLMRDGVLVVPSQYSDPYPITRALIEDGRERLLLSNPIAIDCPVRLLHGQCDPDVPWEVALRIAEQVTSQDILVTLVKDGDHRLSRPQDLGLLQRTLAALLGG
jgi:pimeloyl-ACP methyl ester carboxylesterase